MSVWVEYRLIIFNFKKPFSEVVPANVGRFSLSCSLTAKPDFTTTPTPSVNFVPLATSVLFLFSPPKYPKVADLIGSSHFSLSISVRFGDFVIAYVHGGLGTHRRIGDATSETFVFSHKWWVSLAFRFAAISIYFFNSSKVTFNTEDWCGCLSS